MQCEPPAAGGPQLCAAAAAASRKWAIDPVLRNTVSCWCPRTIGYGAKRAAPA
eukprot:COSAG01_NODE_1198_length_11294_cov_16.374632_5_plen_53_part_00